MGALSAQDRGADGEKSIVLALGLPITVTLSTSSTPILTPLINDMTMLISPLVTSQGVCKDQIR